MRAAKFKSPGTGVSRTSQKAKAKAADKSVRSTRTKTIHEQIQWRRNVRPQLAQGTERGSRHLHALSASGRLSRACCPREAPRLPRLRVLGQARSRFRRSP